MESESESPRGLRGPTVCVKGLVRISGAAFLSPWGHRLLLKCSYRSDGVTSGIEPWHFKRARRTTPDAKRGGARRGERFSKLRPNPNSCER